MGEDTKITGLRAEAEQLVARYSTRRYFLRRCGLGLGMTALGQLLGYAGEGTRAVLESPQDSPLLPKPAMFAPRARSVIFLHMAGAPSQLELFDYKPTLEKLNGRRCPESLLEGKRFAFIKGIPRLLGPQARFERCGNSGAMVSELLPSLQTVVDDVTFLKAMHTDEFNHAPAQLLLHTGVGRVGRPSMGSWITYGLGSENQNLPGFVVLVSGQHQPSAGKSVWGSGFLPSVYQGVQCRSEGDPVLYVSDPPGFSRDLRRQSIETINRINRVEYDEVGDPEILTRISQYEMAFRMQMSVPEAMDISEESQAVHEMYGTSPGGTSFANNCLLARRLVERGVRFVQLFHWGWDAHGASKDEAINHGFKERCKEVDQPMAALVRDLKQRGLLEETVVVWGGEFGRTPMQENRDGVDNPYLGRDHLSDAFTMWVAGGGVKRGLTYGETDEIGYAGVSGRVHVHDLQATLLHLLGMDHERLTYLFQGRNFRLTDVAGEVVREILA